MMNPLDYVRGMSPRAEGFRDDLGHRARQVRNSLNDAGEMATERGERMLAATEDFARNEPLKALGIAAAIGALAVLILTSKWPTGNHER